MFTVLTCIQQEHDLRFVVLAALICVVAAISAFGFHRRARTRADGYFAWIALTGLVGGSGIWATHFIAMLAYEPSLNIHYDMLPTALSWVVAVVGVAAGFALATWRPSLVGRLVAGALVGLSIGGMHFIGMAAVRLSGVVLWKPAFVVASLIIGAIGAATAMAAVNDKPGLSRRLAAPGLFVLAIVGLHFTAMAAAIMLPSNGSPEGAFLLDRGPLAFIVVIIAALIFAAAGSLFWMERFAEGATFRSVRAALDALPSGVAFFDQEQRLLAWNAAFRELVGPRADLARRLPMDTVLYAADNAGVLPEAARDVGGLKLDLLTGSGRTVRESRVADGRWMRLEARQAPDGGAAIILTDTTEANSHAETLAVARDAAEAANKAKSEFLANMSHEIRTPLNGVMGLAEALNQTRLTKRQGDMLRIIRESGETLDALLADILDWARVESGEVVLTPQPVDVSQLCRSVTDLFAGRAREKGLAIRANVEAGADVRIMADPLRLKQILTNLVSNAVKFTGAGGVTVTASRNATGRLRLEVRDSGPGFDEAIKARIFGEFDQGDGSTTREHGGVGLGLPLCLRLAALMGAEFGCEATRGVGAQFYLEGDFPLAEGPAAPAEPVAGDADDHPPRVLVVDDNAVNRQVLELILDSAGLEHEAAENGKEALALVERRAFDAVLMDIQMPVMDGLEATRRIRALEVKSGRNRAPIYIVSANCLPEHVAAGQAAGADGHIAKPVSAAKVLGALVGAA